MSLDALKDFSNKLLSKKDAAHDSTHIERIMRLCSMIAPYEADTELISQAACFHGLLREEKNIRDFLASSGLDSSRIDKIIVTVRNARSVAEPNTIEEKVLHDPNILEGLGAIGIARAFTKGRYEHQTLSETVEFMKKNMERKLYTKKAKEIAEERKLLMKNFLKILEKEL